MSRFIVVNIRSGAKKSRVNGFICLEWLNAAEIGYIFNITLNLKSKYVKHIYGFFCFTKVEKNRLALLHSIEKRSTNVSTIAFKNEMFISIIHFALGANNLEEVKLFR